MSERLTTLNKIKTRLGLGLNDFEDDDLLTHLLDWVSDRFADYCNRKFGRSATADYQFRANTFDLLVDRFPIESVTTFHLKATEADGFVLQSDVDYVLNPPRNIVELGSPLGTSREVGKVIFAGGYVLPDNQPGDSGQEDLPQVIEQSCVEQIAYFYQNRNRLGLVSVSGEGGSVQQFAQLDLLPTVQAGLRRYERLVL